MCCAKFCQFAAGLIVGFGAFCLGASMSWGAQIGEKIDNGALGFKPNEIDIYWQASYLTLGAAFVCMPFSFLMNKLGSKTAMIIAIVPSIAGWGLVIFGKTRESLIIGRVLLGVGGGSFCVAAPVYTTEIAEIKNRGVFGTFYQLLLTFGILFAYVTGAFVDPVEYHSALCAIPAVLLFVLLFFVPASPVFLIYQGKPEKAEKELQKLRGKNADISEEFKHLNDEHQKSAEAHRPLCQALCTKVPLKALFICIALMIGQQVGGINAFVFYSTEIFKDVKSSLDPKIVTILLGIIMFFATVVQIFLIDVVGRKILMIISATSEAIACYVFGVYFLFKEQGKDISSVAWIPILMLFLYIIGFSIGMGPIPWLMIGELFEDDIKAFAASIVGTINWLLAFAVTYSFKLIVDAAGGAVCFWIFAIVNTLCIFFVIFIMPETSKKTYTEIQRLLGGVKDFFSANR